jgi:hypothetical protein
MMVNRDRCKGCEYENETITGIPCNECSRVHRGIKYLDRYQDVTAFADRMI